VSKARCVQSLGENFAVFTAAFAPAFSAALASANASAAAAFPAVLTYTAAASLAVPASAFASAG
jgi:hypothetical protein